MTERFVAPDRSAFARIAHTFARSLKRGDIVALHGDLGAGKTTFVGHVAQALGSSSDVASPTFTFWHRYAGPIALEHLDLYRIEDPREALELGLDEALETGGIAFVEWPDKLPGFVPATAIAIRISGSGDTARTLEIERPA